MYHRKDIDSAEEMLKRVLAIDPSNSTVLQVMNRIKSIKSTQSHNVTTKKKSPKHATESLKSTPIPSPTKEDEERALLLAQALIDEEDKEKEKETKKGKEKKKKKK